MSALDSQIAGDWYRAMSIQPAEFLYANKIPYLEGCAIKYLCRHRAKNGIEDLDKAIHYIQLLKELELRGDSQPGEKSKRAVIAKLEGYVSQFKDGLAHVVMTDTAGLQFHSTISLVTAKAFGLVEHCRFTETVDLVDGKACLYLLLQEPSEPEVAGDKPD